METSPALSVSDLGYAYGARQALTNVSFDIAPGEFCALLGPNGAGKSTLFSLLTRLLVARRGRIVVAGHSLTDTPRAALARLGIVFQQMTLDLDLTVDRNLTYFAALQGLGPQDARPRIDAALDRMGMIERRGEKVRALNGGHRRRMELARALIHRPDILLLDEPTVGLDTESRASIVAHAHDLARSGMAVLWATHLVDEIDDDDTVLVLHRGEALAHDRARDLRGDLSIGERFAALTGRQDAAA